MLEQIIEEMERYKTELFLTIANTGYELKDAKYVGASYAIDKCIEIAEKYKADKCRWNTDYGIYEVGCCDRSFMIWHGFKHCPYCGKEIEIDARTDD